MRSILYAQWYEPSVIARLITLHPGPISVFESVNGLLRSQVGHARVRFDDTHRPGIAMNIRPVAFITTTDINVGSPEGAILAFAADETPPTRLDYQLASRAELADMATRGAWDPGFGANGLEGAYLKAPVTADIFVTADPIDEAGDRAIIVRIRNANPLRYTRESLGLDLTGQFAATPERPTRQTRPLDLATGRGAAEWEAYNDPTDDIETTRTNDAEQPTRQDVEQPVEQNAEPIVERDVEQEAQSGIEPTTTPTVADNAATAPTTDTQHSGTSDRLEQLAAQAGAVEPGSPAEPATNGNTAAEPAVHEDIDDTFEAGDDIEADENEETGHEYENTATASDGDHRHAARRGTGGPRHAARRQASINARRQAVARIERNQTLERRAQEIQDRSNAEQQDDDFER